MYRTCMLSIDRFFAFAARSLDRVQSVMVTGGS
jgi:hypothetical protein